jgi:type II secretory pathway pseudopilin PulG
LDLLALSFALLIAVLLPALTSARRQAQLVRCQSNLRQIGVALQMYMQSSKDYMPAGRVGPEPQARNGNHATPFAVVDAEVQELQTIPNALVTGRLLAGN